VKVTKRHHDTTHRRRLSEHRSIAEKARARQGSGAEQAGAGNVRLIRVAEEARERAKKMARQAEITQRWLSSSELKPPD
jgi:hypothetical protein